jgi:Rab-like protein 2
MEGPIIEDDFGEPDVKIILLGDSAVGKSKLVERYLQDSYDPRRLSTHALTLYRKNVTLGDDNEQVKVDLWDTAGQEKFNSMHPSYFYKADVCILVFDVTRKQVRRYDLMF